MPDTHKALVWDETTKRFLETGVSKVALYLQDTNGKYPKGVAWNGCSSITESPGGAEATDLWADNIKYASLRSAETFGATIECYTYPDEWEACDGRKEVSKGVYISQQSRSSFGLCYRTEIQNDTPSEDDDAYKLHIIYNATASPSEKGYNTISDSPDAVTFSYELETTPIPVAGSKPTAHMIIDSRTADKEKLKQLEEILYGKTDVEEGDGADARLPLPDEIVSIMGAIVPVMASMRDAAPIVTKTQVAKKD